MTQEECAQLLEHTQRSMRAAGMEDVVVAVAEDPETVGASPPAHLMTLLSAMEDAMLIHHRGVAESIGRRFAEFVRTPDGEPVGRVQIELAPAHADLFGRNEPIDLTDAPDLTPVMADLTQFRRDVLRSLEEEG